MRLDMNQEHRICEWATKNDPDLYLDGTSCLKAAIACTVALGFKVSGAQLARLRPKTAKWHGYSPIPNGLSAGYYGPAWRRFRDRAKPFLKNGRSVQEVARLCKEDGCPVPLIALRGMAMPKGIKLTEGAARPAEKEK